MPRQFIPSVEKGVRAQMERGVAAGYPVVDIRVTLVDGKAHSVDSSDVAFQMAGALALREAAKASTVHAARAGGEAVTVMVSDEYVGAVMSDLSGRRGRVVGTEPVGGGRTLVSAEVPELEITAVRGRPALDLPRHRPVHPALPAARPDARARGPQGHGAGRGLRRPVSGQPDRGFPRPCCIPAV